MKKVSRIWLWLFLVFLGYSGGIVTGVVVDVDTVYQTTVKRLKQKNSPGGTIDVVVDVDNPPPKTRKEIREERREERQAERAIKKAAKKLRNEENATP